LTLVELLVVLTVGGAMLALIVGIAVRQQRIFGDLAEAVALDGHLREATSILPIDLRPLAATLGDIRDARDTALEIRTTIATAIICDTSGSRLILAPVSGTTPGTRDVGRFASIGTPIDVGDTAWFMSVTDTSETWLPSPIAAVGSASPGVCAPIGPRLDASTATTPRVAISLTSPPPAPLGVPTRITRPFRYSLYHASDGDWYLGARDWNAAGSRFNTIQPVAGPYLPAAAAGGGLHFAFFDSVGSAIATPVSDVSSIRTIEIDVSGQTRSIVRALGGAAVRGRRVDSSSVVVTLRGGR
jgi:hypothetical protein